MRISKRTYTKRKFDTSTRKMVRTKVRYVDPSPERMEEIQADQAKQQQAERARVGKPERPHIRAVTRELRPSHTLGKATDVVDWENAYKAHGLMNGNMPMKKGPRQIIMNDRQDHSYKRRMEVRKAYGV